MTSVEIILATVSLAEAGIICWLLYTLNRILECVDNNTALDPIDIEEDFYDD